MATSLSSHLLLQVDGGCFRDKPSKSNNLPIATHHLVTFAADLPFSFNEAKGLQAPMLSQIDVSNHLPG